MVPKPVRWITSRVTFLYHSFVFNYWRAAYRLGKHPSATLFTDEHGLGSDAARASYCTVPRDGNCGYFSILCCIYASLQDPTSKQTHGFTGCAGLDILHRSDPALISEEALAKLRREVAEILLSIPRFSELRYAQACKLGRWMRLIVAANMLADKARYADALYGEDVADHARRVVATESNCWLSYPDEAVLADALALRIENVCAINGLAYRNTVGRDSNGLRIVLINTNNRHFEPIIFDRSAAE
ncbi:hypothetical protein PAPHI01_0883 [Pancytospora philotis]|nr:hypothetical protein PAPHI01_0883 [Pancytospora philotis]